MDPGLVPMVPVLVLGAVGLVPMDPGLVPGALGLVPMDLGLVLGSKEIRSHTQDYISPTYSHTPS